jgi:hypothetical protein
MVEAGEALDVEELLHGRLVDHGPPGSLQARVKLLFVWGVKSTPYAGVEVPHSGCFGRQDALYPDRVIM